MISNVIQKHYLLEGIMSLHSHEVKIKLLAVGCHLCSQNTIGKMWDYYEAKRKKTILTLMDF